MIITETRDYIETPEGADLPLDPAGPGVRIAAFGIDLLIRLAIVLVLSFFLGYIDEFGLGVFFIVVFVIEWFYPVYFEVWRNGSTPGKKVMGILVVNEDASPINFAGSLLRNLLRVIDSFPVILYVPALICCLCTRKFQRLGDLAAGTLVVYMQPKRARPQSDEKGKTTVPADFNLEEQRALIAFAERSRSLSYERQQELAEVLAPILKTDNRIRCIKQMANTLIGND